jgi:hypothetical protein
MKYAIGSCLLIIITAFAFSLPEAHAAYCPAQAVNPYAYVCLEKDSFAKGETVSFVFRQGRIPIFIGPDEHPWFITDDQGKTVFTPSSTPPSTQPNPIPVFADSWDQTTDKKGHQAHKGTYILNFAQGPYIVQPVTFMIRNK